MTPDHLRTVSGEVLDLIDAAHQHMRFLGGAQDGLNGAPTSYDSGQALADLEHGWQTALHAANTKAAVDADTLSINADSYTLLEQGNDGRALWRAAGLIEPPSENIMSVMEAKATVESIEQAWRHNQALGDYVDAELAKLHACRADYVNSDEESAGRLRKAGGG